MVVPEARGGLLVVDDEPFLREAVAASLRFLGFQVTTADTAADALRLARDRPFDLVVLDVMLPDGDGFEVVRRPRRKLVRYGPDLIHTQRAVGYSLRLPRG